MRFTKTGPTGGDETAPYSVSDYRAKTIEEFVNEVLEQKTEDLGSVQSIQDIAKEELGLVDPNTVIIDPE